MFYLEGRQIFGAGNIALIKKLKEEMIA